ncbi:Tudor/PWWP/MBT superfamily protein [Abeliophyllum distichum]|uniref:Tudor/PWWP/MBT superfamily protein n=1 Tax=Abeliophyllum distichum TaxID=126358 RepID=A0ABD1RXL5_9LAMI
MGSSGEYCNKDINSSVGGLVWVRRRNGSWWPGRILDPDELPESCLPTPRSGTPVKLLGREDASVDWYNLEKSKRVKAFRCGEYNECIEKAKSSSNSSKKAVKYARREDAILHALELESAHLGKDHPDFSIGTDVQDGDHRAVNELPTSFNPSEESKDIKEDLSSSKDDSDSAQELSRSGVSFEEPDHVDAAKKKIGRWRTPNDSEDDGMEGVKRMRGLEDLGMGVVSSLKRKRSPVAHVHEFLKRKNRRRTLTKVMENAVMLCVPVVCEQLASPTGSSAPGPSDNKVSGLESNETKKNNSMAINNNAENMGASCENETSLMESCCARDAALNCKQKENETSNMVGFPENDSSERLFDVPLIAEEKHSAAQRAQGGAGTQSSQSSFAPSLGNEELNESGSTSAGIADIHNASLKIEKGTSEWQLKGKRNLRARKVGLDYESETYTVGNDRAGFPDGSGQNVDCISVGGLILDSCICPVKSRSMTDIQTEEFHGWSRNAPRKESHIRQPTDELPAPQRLLPYRRSRFTVNPKYDSSDFSFRHHNAGSGLYDITVEVKTGYQPQQQHIPYVSLMSKLNGQPIIGHLLTIEVLDDGYCDNLVIGSECYSSSSELNDCLDADATALQSCDVVYEQRQHGRALSKYRVLHPQISPSESPKSRRNGLLSKKIRKLSSLTGSNRQAGWNKQVVEKLKGPAIACVPLKVVFSRINAALHCSLQSTHRFAATSHM